MSLAQERRTVL